MNKKKNGGHCPRVDCQAAVVDHPSIIPQEPNEPAGPSSTGQILRCKYEYTDVERKIGQAEWKRASSAYEQAQL